MPAIRESARTSISVTINRGPASDRIATYTIPAAIVRQGIEAILLWLAHTLKEEACSKTK